MRARHIQASYSAKSTTVTILRQELKITYVACLYGNLVFKNINLPAIRPKERQLQNKPLEALDHMCLKFQLAE
jgi:hypothetical protein